MRLFVLFSPAIGSVFVGFTATLFLARGQRSGHFDVQALRELLPEYPKCSGDLVELRLRDRQPLVVDRVVLMTPENIYLNSILDMSDEHLRKIYSDFEAL